MNRQSQKLLDALQRLREELNIASEKKESVSPLMVKEAISHRLTQFAGWSQQVHGRLCRLIVISYISINSL